MLAQCYTWPYNDTTKKKKKKKTEQKERCEFFIKKNPYIKEGFTF
jgi:hypothetical protein